MDDRKDRRRRMPERAKSRGKPRAASARARAGRPDGGPRDQGLLRRIGLAEVYNPSMQPTLYPGDQLVVHYGGRVRAGDVVVLRHPFQHDLLIVKRVLRRRGAAGWWVQGDNPAVRNDSREFGAVPDELLVARALLRVRPRRAAGRGAGAGAAAAQASVFSLLRWALSAVRPLVPPPASRLRAR
ncbi:nickel-type superoxide dismutase maturation protease [Streptomyces sp. RKND-216]|uniref:nickel-type superoxide dismutase maturation protease n=1 Tax=Streptomyces sp. RKND-216 TaxID=2562581 RepID=UPI002493BFCE|nr:nickel-type superoxide dismutase maturation protease [Streptomyces sp. RKND-216]